MGAIVQKLLVCLSIAPLTLWIEAGAVPADLVVKNALVLTMDAKLPRAEAFVVSNGKFIMVGGNEQLKDFIGPNTLVLDLGGKTVTPGFIDAHAHPRPEYPEAAPWASVNCQPKNAPTIEAVISALKRKAASTPVGQWIQGTGYQETKLGRHPTRWDLDRASTNHPIIISHSSGHQSVCNSLALQLAKFTGETPDPSGGKLGRQADGELDGLLQERAAAIVCAAGPKRPVAPEKETTEAYRAGFGRFISRGVTSMHVAGTSPNGAEALQKARTAELPLRFFVMFRESSIDEAIRRKSEGNGDEGMRYGAIKIFHGNSLSAQTCWLSKPYTNSPDYFGVPPARSQAALNELILKIHRAGLQVCVHSNGDREIDMVLTAFDAALKEHPRPDHRHRIEHCSVVTPELLGRMKKLGIVAIPHSYIWEHGDKMEAYGEWRWEWMHAARSFLDNGIPMAAHSDDPVSIADPLLRIQDMVTRKSAEGKIYGSKQRITAEEALRAWTLGGAYAAFEENQKGSITSGKLADFVVLSSDPTTTEPERIKEITIEKTVIGGKIVFDHR